MAAHYLAHVTGIAAAGAQEHFYGSVLFHPGDARPGTDELGADEIDFIRRRDSLYLASITETGWPYVQHRGGVTGFLRVLNSRQLGFLDLRGNRQMIFTGNVAVNPKVSLFLMDYPRRERLKILGTARVLDAREQPELLETLQVGGAGGTTRAVERIVLIDVVSFDWNCPKHITPRYTGEEVQELVEPLRTRIRDLEAALRQRQTAGGG